MSVLVTAGSIWIVWPDDAAMAQIEKAIDNLDLAAFAPFFAAFLATTAIMHFLRAWRWHYLLRPAGVELPPARTVAIASVGFMMVIVLPARLGEFARPALARMKGRVSAAAVLGTIVVERVIDGLIASLVVFLGFVAAGDAAPGWMLYTSMVALAVFIGVLVFVLAALRWPALAVNIAVRVTFARHFSDRLETFVRDKLHSLIEGFSVLRDRRSLCAFIGITALYWFLNGVTVWIFAEGFSAALAGSDGLSLDLTLGAAITVICWVALGVVVPNTPALVGQYQALMVFGMVPFVGSAAAHGPGQLFAFGMWASIVSWYVIVGLIALATPFVSLRDIAHGRQLSTADDTVDDDVGHT